MNRPSVDTRDTKNTGKRDGHNTHLNAKKRHEIHLSAREVLKVHGVVSVDGFDDKEVIVETDLGVMHVKGDRLHINELNLATGHLHLTGAVTSVEYVGDGTSKKVRRKNFFSRIMK